MAAVGVGTLLSPPVGVDAFGTLGRAEAATPEVAASPASAGPTFPGVPGVDLATLGYRGVDLDAVSVASLGGALPELPMDRASEVRSRMVVGTAHLEGLRQAEYLLYEAVRAMNPKIAWSRRAQLEAWEIQAKAEKQLRRHQTRVAALDALRAQRPALDIDADPGVSAAELAAAEVAAQQARAESARLDDHLEVLLARRSAHRAALDHTAREIARMDAHVRYLGNELRAARAGMRSAGRWLVESWRGRADIPVVRVEGFTVHASIARALQDLLDHARKDGIDLRGDAFRSIDRQIELRQQNCGPTHQDIYQRPSGACSPPTARPGRSLHESGLAVDFRHGEEGIGSRSSPAYQWLAANAAQYGFYNLPSEPWHWSVSGV